MTRRVLNEPVRHAALEPGPAAERLQGAMLGALGEATDDAGRVDYPRLAASHSFAAAVEAARALGGVRVAGLAPRHERLAFWINIYNALVLHGIVALQVRHSVRRVWNFFGRVAYRVGEHVLSLDDIEHGLLRDNARRPLPPLRPFRADDPRRRLAVTPPDPRYHCAVTCGAASCPPVGVYRASAIDAQLDLAARSFVNQEVTLEDGRLTCSKIFRWYRADFEATGGLRAFLLRHLDEGPVRAALTAGATPCAAFRPYRWTLQHPPVT
jgi:hypothetical protein